MPKKSRQAHVPKQQSKRKARRPAAVPPPRPREDVEPAEPVFADRPIADVPGFADGVVAARPLRRLEQLRATRETFVAGRVVPGQLPTFERAYLVSELRRIMITAGSLLALIIVLAILLR